MSRLRFVESAMFKEEFERAERKRESVAPAEPFESDDRVSAARKRREAHAGVQRRPGSQYFSL